MVRAESGHTGSHDVRLSITKGLFVAVHNPELAIDAEPFSGDGRSRNVCARLFQSAALVRFASGGPVQSAGTGMNLSIIWSPYRHSRD